MNDQWMISPGPLYDFHKLGAFVAQRHNKPRDLEAEILSTVCNDEETEPVISGETVE